MALDLTLQSTKDYILEKIQDAVKYDDKRAAQEVLKIMRDELPGQQEQVAGVPGLYDVYKQAWVAAQFICLPSIAEDDFFDLIREHLVEGLRLAEYDIIDKIGLRISFMFLEAEQVAFMEQLLDIIRKNSGTLGSQNINVAGRTALPTVANWLADYDTYPSQAAQRSDLEQITYISKSPNAVALSNEDKKVLIDILDCYDSLRNLLSYYRSLPEATEDLLNKPENLYQFYPGAEVVDSIEGENESSTPTPAPIPQPAVAEPPPRPALPIQKPAPKPAAPAPPKPPANNSVAEEIKNNLKGFNVAPARPPLNVQDFLNERHNKGNSRGGIVFDNPPKPPAPPANLPTASIPQAPASARPPAPPAKTAMPAPAPTPQPSNIAADAIAKKLAELRKRKQP